MTIQNKTQPTYKNKSEIKGLVAKVETTINATADKVWEALINPKKIKEYMFDTTVISAFTKGSTITWQGEINGKKYKDKGKILEIIPEKKLQYSHFSSLSKLADAPENYHMVTIILTSKKDKTSITLTQDKNGNEKEQKQMEKNWAAMLESLKNLLENKIMSKLIVISDITLDGVMQAPGGPEEDTSDGFKFGGWIASYLDEATNRAMEKQIKFTDILLGRKTFEIFASYWPKHAENWPGINDATKYVMSKTMEKSVWKNTVFIKSLEDIKKLKNTEGSDLKVWGSGKLIQFLLKNDLMDELWLKIYPVTIGEEKKLFNNGTLPAAFTLIENTITPSGVIMASYKQAGEVRTGTVGD